MKYFFFILVNILSLSYCYSQQLNDSNFHNTISMWFDQNQRPQVIELYGEIEDWDTSQVTNMSEVFNNTTFNRDISSWDVSNVTNMYKMFFQAYSFNQPIGTWDVSQVTNMNQMFHEAISFNQDISEWNVSSVTDMNKMFSHAHEFNQNLSSWNFETVSNLENFLFLSYLNVENYDALLISLSNQNLINDIGFGAWPLNYCNSQSERDSIINDFGWNINDGGQSSSCTMGVHDYQKNKLEITPNPFMTHVYFSIPNENYKIKIFNSIGMLIFNDFAYSELDLSFLKPGLYFLLAFDLNNNNVLNKKIIKI